MARFDLRIWAALTILLPGACSSPLAITGGSSHTVRATVGQELDITLQTIGPGEYVSPPSISSTAVRFLDVTLVSPHVPAGPTQRFRFKAAELGTAIIVIRHSDDDPTVTDTVEVF